MRKMRKNNMLALIYLEIKFIRRRVCVRERGGRRERGREDNGEIWI